MTPNRVRGNVFLIVLTAALVVLTSTHATAQNIYETEEGKKFEVRLVPAAKEIFLNEQALLNVEIRNLSDTPLVFMGPGESRLGGFKSPEFKVTVIQPDGVRLPRTNTLAPIGSIFSTEGSSVAIREDVVQSDEAKRFRIKLIESYPPLFLLTGTHRVSIEYTLHIGISDPKKKKPVPTTAEIAIEVLPPDSKKVAELITRLGEAMLKGDETAAERLQGLHDPRRAPWFIRRVEGVLAKEDPDTQTIRRLERDLGLLIRIDETRVEAILKRMLDRKSEKIREVAAQFLSNRTRQKVLPVLLKLAGDTNPAIRLIVAHRFEREWLPETNAALRKMTTDPDESIWKFAQSVFAKRLGPPGKQTIQTGNVQGTFTLRSEQPIGSTNQPTALILEMILPEGTRPVLESPTSGAARASVTVTNREGRIVIEEPGLGLIESGVWQVESGGPFVAKIILASRPDKFSPGTHFITVESELSFKTPTGSATSPDNIRLQLGLILEYTNNGTTDVDKRIAAIGEKAAGKDAEATEMLHYLTAANHPLAIPYLIKIVEQYAEEFRNRQWDRSPEMRQKNHRFLIAVIGLARFKDENVKTVIRKLLENPNLSIRLSTIGALMSSPHSAMRTMMISRWNDPHWFIRRWVLQGLANRTDPEAEHIFRKLLADENENVKWEALQGLQGIQRKKFGY